MDTKSKILFWVFGLLIAGSVAVSYYKFMVARDYVIEAEAECDPTIEKCFVHICNPDPDVDGDACTGNPDEDTWYTKKISRMAYNIPLCDPSDENCDALTCPEGETECSYTFCDETNVPEGDTCNYPDAYNLAHPEEEDTSEEDDTEEEATEEATEETTDNESGTADESDAGTTDTTPQSQESTTTPKTSSEMIP